MPIPFDVPAQFFAAEQLGNVVRFGAILKDADTGRIVGHMQETGLLSKLASVPANSFLSPVDAASSLASNYQLYRVDQKVAALQEMVSGVASMQLANLAIAGLGVGISVAGFAVIKSRIERVENRLEGLEALVRSEFARSRMNDLKELEADLNGQLDHAEEGWQTARGNRIWTRVADKLNDMVYRYPSLIEEQLAASQPDLRILGYLLERYRVLGATRVECLVLTGELDSARDFSMRFMDKTHGMLTPVGPMDLAKRRAGDRATDLLERQAVLEAELGQARQFTAAVREFQDLSASRPILIESLIDRRINGRDYIEQLRDEREAPVVVLPEKAA